MRRLSLLALLGCVCAVVTTTPLPAADRTLDDVLRHFDAVQTGIRSLSAEFTETTDSALLTETTTAKGRVFLTKPDSVRWEYRTPEEMSFVIRADEYTGYFPARKQAERRDIRRWREQLFRFLGLGQASAELSKFYDLSLGEKADERPGTLLLVMDPKKKRVRKRMDAVHFWIDAKTYLPVRVEYHSTSGNRRVIEFDEVMVNPELAKNLFTVELPADVEVTKGFSALSGFSASD